MKKYILIICMVIIASCQKSGDNNVANNTNTVDPHAGVTVGNTTTYNGYVVKTIGVSRVMVAVDDNYKLVTAYFYGGGNKVVLKTGTTNIMSNNGLSLGILPDAVDNVPDGDIGYQDKAIDNGVLADTLSGSCIKLKGFDRSKTGYDQLNVVMMKYMFPSNYTGGYYNNLTFLKMKEAAGKKNADYQGRDFISGVFTGGVTVSSVEIAAPVSANPYITEDHVISSFLSNYGVKEGQGLNTTLTNLDFAVSTSTNMGTPLWPVPKGLTAEWVNADNGTIVSSNPYGYSVKFTNIKIGGRELVPEAADSVTNVFLRIKGFDRTQFGFNQLRLFLVNDGFYNGLVQMNYNAIPTFTTTVASVKASYNNPAYYYLLASPVWHHY